MDRLSSTDSEILAFSSQCSVNFQPILDCFFPKVNLKYDDLENIKQDHVNTVVLSLHQIEQSKLFLGDSASLLSILVSFYLSTLYQARVGQNEYDGGPSESGEIVVSGMKARELMITAASFLLLGV